MRDPGGYNREDSWKELYEESGEKKTGETDFRGFAELFKERGMKGFKISDKETSGMPEPEGNCRYASIPQSSLDLHGHTQAEAEKLLQNFITNSRELNYKFVLVITGLGRNSEGGVSKLRPLVNQILNGMINNQQVKDFKTADPRHGGYGAVYVYLK